MFKHLICAALLLVSMTTFAQKKELPEVAINKLPTSTDEFIEMRNSIATTPQGGAAMFVVASILYVQNPELGRQCLIIASDKDLLGASNKASSYKGFDFGSSSDFLIKQLDSKKYVPYSYVQGTSPTTNYVPVTFPYRIACVTNPYSGNEADGVIKVFVKCTGADSDRPITLKRNEQGYWKAKEFSSLMSGVRPPQQKSAGAASGDF